MVKSPANGRSVVSINQSTSMKALLRLLPFAFVSLFLTLFMTGCSAIGDIFKAGAYTGIIGVVLVVAVLIWLASKFLGGGGNRNG